LICRLRGRLARENLLSALMSYDINLQPDAGGLRIGLVVSRYHAWATNRLLDGAVDRFLRLGGEEANIVSVSTSGAWELTGIARALCERIDLDGVLCER